MTIMFLGGEVGSVVAGTGGVYEVTTTDGGATPYDTDNARCAIRLSSYADWCQSPTLSSSQAAIGYAWSAYYPTAAVTTRRTIFEMYASSTPQIRVTATMYSDMALELDYWDGSAWVNSGSHSASVNEIVRLEVFCNKTSGVLQLYVEGTLWINETESLSHLSSFTHCRWYGPVIGAGYISELSGATTANAVPTVKTRYVNGNGAQTTWTGDYTGVDEMVFTDSDGITSAAGDEVETFTHTGPDLEAFNVLAVGLGIRGKKGATGPTGQKGVLRISGTNYVSDTDTLSTGYGAFTPIWETNPATAAAWTGAAAEGAEIGVKSIT